MFTDDLPPTTGGHSPISSQSHFSPRLLTPDIDADHQHDYHPPMTVHSDGDEPDPTHAHGLSFAKQPLHPARATSVKKGFAGVMRDGSASSSRRTSGRGGHLSGTDGALSDGALSYALSSAVGPSAATRASIRGKDGDSDGQSHRGSPTKNVQVSLLSAIMTSPEHGSIKGLCRPHTAPVLGGAPAVHGDGKTFASNPSTALSSPTSTSAHGILRRTPSHQTAVDVDDPGTADRREVGQGRPHGILRRGSMSGTEAGLGPAFAHTHSNNTGRSIGTSKLLESKLIQADEKRVQAKEGRIGWADDVFKPEASAEITQLTNATGLARAPSAASTTGRPALKFAMASKPSHAPSHGSTSASETGDASRRSSSSRRALSPFARERSAQDTIHDSDRPFDAQPVPVDDSEDEEAAEEEEEEEDEDQDTSPPAYLPGYVPRPGSGARLHVRSGDFSMQPDDDSDSSDAGYEEDEEDGMFSSDDETSGRILDGVKPSSKFPFARSTNYWNRRESREDASPGASPPAAPAPVFAPPPNRRGRGHVRVADAPIPRINTGGMTTGKEGGCTRHCSPPPQSRSRSSNAGLELEEEAETGEMVGRDGTKSALYGKVQEAPPAAASPSARRMKRPFDPPVSAHGKGQGKTKMAGSPMPPRLGDDEEDEEEEEDEDEEAEDATGSEEEEDGETVDEDEGFASSNKPARTARRGAGGAVSDHPGPLTSVAASYRSGWRSDDAAFYGPKARVSRPASRNVSESAQGVPAASGNAAVTPKAMPTSDLASSVFSETEDDATRTTAGDEGDTGVRGFIRRASEHLPMFRRPSVSNPPVSYAQPVTATAQVVPAIAKGRDGSAHPPTRTPIPLPPSAVASPIPPPQVTIGTCQPILDDTPAKAEHAARAPDGGLAHRLEQTLGTSHHLGVASASMARQVSGSASSRPSVVARESRDSKELARAGDGEGADGAGVVTYPQPTAGGSASARPSLSTQGSAGTNAAPPILAAPPSAIPPSTTGPTTTNPPSTSTATQQPVSALGRAPSLSSGKVTFATPPAHVPRRSVSSAMGIEIVEEAKRRRETRAAGAAAAIQASGLQVRHAETKSAPIKCPKLVQTEDLGWTEGALLNIRKQVGKGEQGV